MRDAEGQLRRGRPRAGEQALTRQRIVAAAVRLAGEIGLEHIAMRRLAKELGVDPMAIYHHIPGKPELISAVAQAIFATMTLPDPRLPWRARLLDWCRSYRALTRRYQGLVFSIARDPDAVAASAAIIGPALADALREAGLDAPSAETASGIFVDYLNGFSIAEVGAGPDPAGLDEAFEQGIAFLAELIDERGTALRIRKRPGSDRDPDA